ncbi:hypothetical protein PGH12_08100 [Chryseobacterium wangxinyae]|uniref:hypothetical protein n=1 Tax=Chryseobacterium sp. CY350 TaxID=2997336 RepID=UPI00226D765C|nr:hypothetical protein [Chryseobacterium sp. CY350]MCY0977106.1 hypothetical protein [Chryseobacterium sp. CY350]WBZ97103.1 hypothetical protein PGH12_08100 [Chryseobacterium sp. CY350]
MSKIKISFSIFLWHSLCFAQEIPILGFIGIPEKYANSANYTKMKNAGISISLMTFSSHENAIKSLEEAEKAGMKLILAYPELYSKPEEVVPKIKIYAAFKGYFMGDEPSPKEFTNYTQFAGKISKFDNSHIFYTNLFPNYVSAESIEKFTYENYINLAVKKLPLTFISFDHYPIINNAIRNNFFENLEVIRRISLLHNKQFWGFACSTIHLDYLQPTISGIKLQNFANLLYGAQGLQYFTYWTMSSDPNWRKNNYSYAIVDEKGNPTPTYEIVKKVNQQIQRLAWVFLDSKSDAIFHTGTTVPKGTVKLTTIPKEFKYFSTNGKNALVSLMSNGKKKFIIIQNTSLIENFSFEYQLKKEMKIVDNSSGKTKNVAMSKKNKSTILPGDILIFTHEN